MEAWIWRVDLKQGRHFSFRIGVFAKMSERPESSSFVWRYLMAACGTRTRGDLRSLFVGPAGRYRAYSRRLRYLHVRIFIVLNPVFSGLVCLQGVLNQKQPWGCWFVWNDHPRLKVGKSLSFCVRCRSYCITMRHQLLNGALCCVEVSLSEVSLSTAVENLRTGIRVRMSNKTEPFTTT